jgi:hypothetical protein
MLFDECTYKNLGGAEVAYGRVHGENLGSSISIGAAPNGTFTFNEMWAPFVCGAGLFCWLGANDLKLPLTGGNQATLAVNKLAIGGKNGSACPETLTLDANYKTTTPVWVYPG